MDVLADWVGLSGPSGVLLARSRMQAPWGMGLSAGAEAMFHIVAEGTCWLRRAGAPALKLQVGDLALLPEGVAHELVHAPDGASEPLAVLIQRTPTPLPADALHATTVYCGVYRFDANLAQPLLRGLPPVLHMSAAQIAEDVGLRSTLALITNELASEQPASQWLLPHLFDALLVYLVRRWVAEGGPLGSGWMVALRDPALSRALTRMHAEPHSPWTVESLAREAGLSRAAFARRFAEQVGEAPLAYLTRWRMGLAARLLRDTHAPLAEIASRVGYDSEFSFSRAFKRSRGQAPHAFRRSQVG
jgi:AraC family transcriptional activator of mtrCDE